MRVMVDRLCEYRRPGTDLYIQVQPGEQTLPRDVAEWVIAQGAGRAVDVEPGDRRGGMAAMITRKQSKQRRP